MRRPVVSFALAALTALVLPCASQAQSSDYAPFIPRLVASAGYSFIYSNDPPGGDHKFDINGGFLSLDYNIYHWLGVSGEFTGGQASNISPIGQNLILYTYTGGPRFTYRRGRYSIFGQVLYGRADGSHSYFPTPTSYTTSASAFAVSDGGGLDYHLNHRYGIRGDVRFLHTTFNNGVNTSQNQLEFNVGIAMKFGGHYINPRPRPARYPTAEPMPEPLPAPSPALTSAPPPPPAAVEAAPIVPAPPAPMPVPPPAPAVASPALVAPAPAEHQDDAHPPVADIYFDYGRTDLQPDAETPLRQVALYLRTHPGQRVLIAGFSDERGAKEHNLELGEQRAMAVRDELVRKGVDGSQVTVVTYGKGAEICLKPEDPCFQRNRRISFMWLR